MNLVNERKGKSRLFPLSSLLRTFYLAGTRIGGDLLVDPFFLKLFRGRPVRYNTIML